MTGTGVEPKQPQMMATQAVPALVDLVFWRYWIQLRLERQHPVGLLATKPWGVERPQLDDM